ncbi:MAG: nitroreductase family protein [Fimbriimonadaceae bacterium]|nr:nitroreductase family protein [Chitinophagales bacterium]
MIDSAQLFDAIVRERRSVRIYDQENDFDGDIVQRSLERAVLAPNSSNMQLWEFYRIIDPIKRNQIAKYCMNQNAARTARELVVVVVRKDKWRERAKFMFNYHKKRIGNKTKTEYTKRDKRNLNYFGKLMPMYYFSDWFGIWAWIRKILVFSASFFRPVIWQVGNSDLRVVSHKSAALAAQTFMLSMHAEGYHTCPMEGFDSWKVRRCMQLPYAAEINMIIACGKGKPEGIYTERIRVDNKEIIFSI